VFSYSRDYFNTHYSVKKADLYSVIAVLVYMWIIIICYIVYYFSEDFYKVFCKKDNKQISTTKENLKKEVSENNINQDNKKTKSD
jgi:hypothetical protein